MDPLRFFRLVTLSGALLISASLYLFCQNQGVKPLALIASTTYMGPKHPLPNDAERIRIEITIRDSAKNGGPQIEEVFFNQQQIPLKPRDVYGSRGNASFFLPPGKYKLEWTVNRDNFAWPRSTTHKEEVLVSPRDLWIQVSIEGDSASIH